MTIEDQIAALAAEAEPLRLLPDDEAESMGLPGIVDMINALRAEQAAGVAMVYVEPAVWHAPDDAPAVDLDRVFTICETP